MLCGTSSSSWESQLFPTRSSDFQSLPAAVHQAGPPNGERPRLEPEPTRALAQPRAKNRHYKGSITPFELCHVTLSLGVADSLCRQLAGATLLFGNGRRVPVEFDLATYRRLLSLLPDCRRDTNWKTYQENASINLLHEAFTYDIFRKFPEVPRVGTAGEPRFELTMEGSLLAFAHSRDQSGATHDGAHLPFKTAMAIIRRVSRRGETVILDLLAAGTQAGNACWWRLANFVAHDLDQSQVIMSGLFLKLQM